MATPTHASTHRTSLSIDGSNQSLGEYNSLTVVSGSTQSPNFVFTGSATIPQGAGFIVEVVTNVTISLPGGGSIPGSALTADTLYPIGVSEVNAGAGGIVYVLHR